MSYVILLLFAIAYKSFSDERSAVIFRVSARTNLLPGAAPVPLYGRHVGATFMCQLSLQPAIYYTNVNKYNISYTVIYIQALIIFFLHRCFIKYMQFIIVRIIIISIIIIIIRSSGVVDYAVAGYIVYQVESITRQSCFRTCVCSSPSLCFHALLRHRYSCCHVPQVAL